jgi:hypothetical protein
VTNYLLGSGSFNHFERLAVIIYTDSVIANASFGSFQTHDDLFNFINNTQQNVNVNTPKITPYVLLNKFFDYSFFNLVP